MGRRGGSCACSCGQIANMFTCCFLQAKFFTESRLLQRYVKVTLLSLPNAAPTPFQAGANATAPPPATIFIGTGKGDQVLARLCRSLMQYQSSTPPAMSPNTLYLRVLRESSTGMQACSRAAAAWSASALRRRWQRRSAHISTPTRLPLLPSRTVPRSTAALGHLMLPSYACGARTRFRSSTGRRARRGDCS